MLELSLNGVKKYMGANLILKNITFHIYEGEKVGVIGANGSGKSTILKLIAGIEKLNCYAGLTSNLGYDEGWISVPKSATKAYLEQIPEYPSELRVIDILHLAFEEVHLIENELRQLEKKMRALEGAELEKVMKRYSELMQLYEFKGGYEVEEKLNKVCKGLKFTDSLLNKEFRFLSGGEKTIVGLGKILIENPDILLLDEPTNHLDMDSVEWLENYLNSYKGIVILVSHDRYFLDKVVTKIIEIEDMECEVYKGNYSTFTKEKEERMLLQFEDFKEQQKQIKAMEKSIKDLRDWAQRADNNKFFKRAASIQKKLEKMDRISKPKFVKQNMKLDLKVNERSGEETIKACDLSKNYADKVLFQNANLLIRYGERSALIGPNGSGKTTFLKLLLGEESPDLGTVELGANVMPAYLPQKIIFNNEEQTVLECFRENFYILEGKAREYLSKFMFYGSSVFKKVKHLSGGERIRLKLSMLLYNDVNLLILDEPTNHLDIESIETFEEALEHFGGTIFIISHDRYFINKICDQVVAVENKNFKSYLGNYEYYKTEKVKFNLKTSKEIAVKTDKVILAKSDDKEIKKRHEIAECENKIEELEKEIAQIDSIMLKQGLAYEDLNELYLKKANLSNQLNRYMDLWLKLSS
ncbi:ribosomal protection-like ABC-F family protein [Alkalihalobacterium elongatum]|uniref:ribosomal protection-like ABC-F family protein n=1 Tax=Alkalihalobacterium elongatum TaxID=2675466 RepID=UPI001C1FCC00|nr:ABC-F family ATP-binding cassette domain-containing protein [Alkalihalobacterium elongatum]